MREIYEIRFNWYIREEDSRRYEEFSSFIIGIDYDQHKCEKIIKYEGYYEVFFSSGDSIEIFNKAVNTVFLRHSNGPTSTS